MAGSSRAQGVFLGGMTLAVPGATGFVALAQRAVIKQIRLHFVDRLPSLSIENLLPGNIADSRGVRGHACLPCA